MWSDDAAALSASPLSDSSRLGHAVGSHGLDEDRDRILGGLAGLAGRDMGGDRLARVVVEEPEAHARASASQHVLGRVELPARVRGRLDEPPSGRARLPIRLQANDTCLAEDP